MATTLSATEFLKNATNVAKHFGFEHIEDIKKSPACKSCDKRIEHKATANDKRLDGLHGLLTGGACSYFEHKMNGIEGPVLFYTTDTVPRTGETAVSLHILNVEKSIAEAILIQTVRALLGDSGYTNSTVRINSLGDQDSMTRYVRELTNFLKKRMDDMPASARELMKDHVFSALMHLVEKEHELALRSPNPMEYLSDQSRKHFREIVEYLDMSETPYEIDSKLIGHHQCYSDALFAIDLRDENNDIMAEQPIYIRGGRYNTFVGRMSKGKVAATGAVIVLRDKKAPARIPRPARGAVPSVFVVQLGFGPKVKSLLLIEEFRSAGIPVSQDIVSDSLSAQLRKAEEQNTRFAVIVGQKEFVDGNVILRDLHSRSQENVPLSGIVNHLRRVVR